MFLKSAPRSASCISKKKATFALACYLQSAITVTILRERTHTLKCLILAALLALPSCGVLHPRIPEGHVAASPTLPDYEPQGKVEEVVYPCSVPGPTTRRMIVYLPEGYYDSQDRYPVIYLLHGARGHEASWIRKGRMLQITDSLFSNRLAVPAIVVMPNMNQYDDDYDYADSRPKKAFESILEVDGTAEWAFTRDVVATVDSLYRTIPDREHRAIAGMSIGGRQGITLAANEPDSYGYVAAFSPYMPVKGRNRHFREFYRGFHQRLDAQFLMQPPKGYYIMNGKSDPYSLGAKAYHRRLERKGYPHIWIETPGGHEWYNWSDYYARAVQLFFK